MQFRLSVIFLLMFYLKTVGLFAQNNTSCQLDSLRKYSALLTLRNPDFEKYETNQKFRSLLETIFNSNNSFSFPFDSIPTISTLISPDKKFKILTWGICKENGNYEYFGYILFPNNSKYSKKYIEVNDNSESTNFPETQILNASNWYGAIYYKIISTRYKSKKYYTLLGWKGNNDQTTKKVIEVLSFRSSGNPVFGALLFRMNKQKQSRVIFEYSSQATMQLRYEKQMIHTVTKPSHTVKSHVNPKNINGGKAMKTNKKTKARIKTVKTNMILFDRLSPIDPRTSKYSVSLEGQYQFYAPETNIWDAFVFTNGKWVFTKDIDARNPAKKILNPKDLPKPEE